MYCIYHCSHMFRIHIRPNPMTEIEHMTTAITELFQNHLNFRADYVHGCV